MKASQIIRGILLLAVALLGFKWTNHLILRIYEDYQDQTLSVFYYGFLLLVLAFITAVVVLFILHCKEKKTNRYE